MHSHQSLIENRVRRVLVDRIRPAVYRRVAPLSVRAWHVEGGQGEPVEPREAFAATYVPFEVGEPWGPAWGTTWFGLRGQVPPREDDLPVEIVFDLGWHDHSPGFQAEGLVYRPDGTTVKGLNPRNAWIPVPGGTSGGEVDLYVEAAANPLVMEVHPFVPTTFGEKSTAGTAPLYQLARAEICVRDVEIDALAADIDVLDELMLSLDQNDAWRGEIRYALERSLDVLDLQNISATAANARAELAAVLARRNAEGGHQISAIGHAHIDSAWLWPARETVRKVARTVSNVVQLLDTYPDLVYAMSSAQQYAWIQEHRPEVFARVAEQVRASRFVPVGGMWVESDTNMVGGEAMARQFVVGQEYFMSTFGMLCSEVWLPDSFGYSAALPQIVRQAGCDRFLTQKISWNQENVFPHHTFWWEGIDGTRVFTHFPPVDTYNSDLSGHELAHAAANFREKGATSYSLAPFGWGDGGGGPTREMIERARRTADLNGSPRVVIEKPSEFFDRAMADYPNAPVWVGELYLELHRGTYTSQAATKQGNRRSEHLLREAELWCTTAAVRGLAEYPAEQLARIWKVVLLQQFHDILPGSSIAWVHREAAENYLAVAKELDVLIVHRLSLLAGEGETPLAINAAPFPIDAAAAMSGSATSTPVAATAVRRDGESVVLDNAVLRVRVAADGTIASIYDLRAEREVVPGGQVAALLQIHPDLPNNWDAWDIDAFYRNTVTNLTEVDDLTVESADDAGAVSIRIRRHFGDSSVVQTITLAPGRRQVDCRVEVDWHERERILKLAFSVDVHADRAAYETQFGHVVRPTHQNTSWDDARFEVCAHRFVHVAERGFGVGLVNSATYGHDITRHAKAGGGTYSVIRASVLRAPRFPDPQTDQGWHVRDFALLVGDLPDTVAAGYAINLPVRHVTGTPFDPLITLSGPGSAVVEAVKLAQDGSGDVVVRIYEPLGARTTVDVDAGFAVAQVWQSDLLERRVEPDGLSAEADSTRLRLRPFQIATLRFRRR